MIRIRQGTVIAVEDSYDGIQELKVTCEGDECKAICFSHLVGGAAPGDKVVLNTTAVYKGLGTGGSHFVMAIEGRDKDLSGEGHIMKVRYTPSQVQVLSAEEERSPHHTQMVEECHLRGMPVAVATLHSLLAPFAVKLRLVAPHLRLGYIMTDGAALPASLSRLLLQLKKAGLVHVSITCGHSFGGDLEAVNIYSALQAAKQVAQCDVCFVAMGPGVVGTGTPLGTTALEQAPLLDAAAALGARSLAVPRISFADDRPRHYGLSHHTATALGRLTQTRSKVAFPDLGVDQNQIIRSQAEEAGIFDRHDVVWQDAGDVCADLDEAGIKVTTMGRKPEETPEFFAAGAVAGAVAADLCNQLSC